MRIVKSKFCKICFLFSHLSTTTTNSPNQFVELSYKPGEISTDKVLITTSKGQIYWIISPCHNYVCICQQTPYLRKSSFKRPCLCLKFNVWPAKTWHIWRLLKPLKLEDYNVWKFTANHSLSESQFKPLQAVRFMA